VNLKCKIKLKNGIQKNIICKGKLQSTHTWSAQQEFYLPEACLKKRREKQLRTKNVN